MYIVIGIILILQTVMLIGLFILRRRLNGMQAQMNSLQERYNEEDYEAFFGSLKKEEEEREAQIEREFIGPVQYKYKARAYSDDEVVEEITVYPDLKCIKEWLR